MLQSGKRWIDHSVFSISNWYPNFHNPMEMHGQHCAAIDFRSGHIDFKRWSWVLCNDSISTKHVFCKANRVHIKQESLTHHTRQLDFLNNTDSSIEIRQSDGNKTEPTSKILTQSLFSCASNWTFIMKHCYRITQQQLNQGDLSHLPSSTIESDERYIWWHVHMYVEGVYRRCGDELKRIKNHGRCKYLVRQSHTEDPTWEKESNCQEIVQINFALTSAGKTAEESCMQGFDIKKPVLLHFQKTHKNYICQCSGICHGWAILHWACVVILFKQTTKPCQVNGCLTE